MLLGSSTRLMHSWASSDSIPLIQGRVRSQAANSVASREVLPFRLGPEKLKWELCRVSARACLFTLYVATDRVKVGHSTASWRSGMAAG